MPTPKFKMPNKVPGDTTVLVKKEAADPDFKTEREHTNFYRSKAITKLKPDDKQMYDSLKTNHSQANADAIIALRGGTPKHEVAKSTPIRKVYPKIAVKSSVGKSKVEGYNYDENRPASKSITLKRGRN